jgi:type VI secretion system protein VasD
MRFGQLITAVQRKHGKFSALALLGLALLQGCSSSGPKQVPPDPFSVVVQADAKANPDSYGRPSPTKVVFYELKSPVTFETADFFSLSQKDQATLGGDMLSREEFFLRPGDSKTLTRKGLPETTSLAVFVEFRDIDKSIWHATANVPPPEAPGMFSSIGSSIGFNDSKQKNYQIQIDQHSVKFVAVATTASNVPSSTPATTPTAPTVAKPAVPN